MIHAHPSPAAPGEAVGPCLSAPPQGGADCGYRANRHMALDAACEEPSSSICSLLTGMDFAASRGPTFWRPVGTYCPKRGTIKLSHIRANHNSCDSGRQPRRLLQVYRHICLARSLSENTSKSLLLQPILQRAPRNQTPRCDFNKTQQLIMINKAKPPSSS